MTSTAALDNREGILLPFSSNQKVNCGLRWDAPTMQGAETIDLDLVCVLFDEDGDYIDMVSGKVGQRISQGGSVYHTGDDLNGNDSGDDERIILDLFSMPRPVHYVFVLTEIHSRHSFDSITNPLIRVADIKSENVFLEQKIGGRDGSGDMSFLFARFERKESGWSLLKIGRYVGGADIPKWSSFLTNFLPRPDPNKKKADKPQVPEKGQSVPLFYTKESRHRIICGLSWDAARGKKAVSADLDLTCVLFDASGEYLDYVTSQASKTVAEDGAVYHTGDNESGAGEGDDEQVSVELARIPEDVHHIVFVVDTKSGHKLGEVGNTQLRIADGMSNRDQLKVSFGEGVDKAGYIFAHVRRGDDGWFLHFIDEYVDTESMEDWIGPITPYLGV